MRPIENTPLDDEALSGPLELLNATTAQVAPPHGEAARILVQARLRRRARYSAVMGIVAATLLIAALPLLLWPSRSEDVDTDSATPDDASSATADTASLWNQRLAEHAFAYVDIRLVTLQAELECREDRLAAW